MMPIALRSYSLENLYALALACPPRTIYSVERLPNGYTRITQNGRVTFNGLMGRVTA